jgi:hypothetical protein
MVSPELGRGRERRPARRLPLRRGVRPASLNAIGLINARLTVRRPQDEQTLLAAAAAMRRLLDVIVRDRMTFLLPDRAPPAETAGTASASQKETLAHQQALRDLLSPAFRDRFRQRLHEQWVIHLCCLDAIGAL